MDVVGLEKLLKICPDAVSIAALYVPDTDNSGLQLLHRAAMTGNLTTVQILLNMHADPNAVASAGETPLLFACHSAHLKIMHLLVQSGANIDAVDNAGCGAIHYAVNGGQVAAVHYLNEVCGLSTHTRDNRLQTPLFKACNQGHVDMLNYLLRKGRSEVDAEDAAGNTAIHVAAEKCYSWSCWRLLEEGGLQLLHKANKDNLMPLDVAIKASATKNSQTVKMLRYYTSVGMHTGHLTGPRIIWWCHLLMPAAAYLAILIIIQFTHHRGLVASGLLIGLIKSMMCHTPRMRSYCRWPNPVFTGMFAAGLFYTTTCIYREILKYIYMEYPVVTAVCASTNIAMLIVYYKMITSHPGLCKSSSVNEDTGHVYNILDVAKGNVATMAFCPVCEIIMPKSSHHCKLCDGCICELDHHCLLMSKCIGRGNQRLFVLFLVICIISMGNFSVLTVWYLSMEFSVFIVPTMDIVQAIFDYYTFLWTMVVGNTISMGWCIGMLISQVWMISNGYWIAYRAMHGSKLTYRERIDNVVAFLLGERVKQDVCQV